jgi:hypothetical protein
MADENGHLDTAELAVIPGGTKMGGDALIRRDLLPGVVALQAAFQRRFGAPLRPTSAGDGYRSYQRQVNAFLGRYAPQRTGMGPFYDVRWWRGVRYVRVSGASAAVPGTSNHGWGVAVDFADVGASGGERWRWLMDAAPRFGFVNPLWARDGDPTNGSQEPWHWEGRAVPVSNYRAFLAGMGVTVPDLDRPAPITPKPRRRHMLILKDANGPAHYVATDLAVTPIGDAARLTSLLKVYGPVVELDAAQITHLQQQAGGNLHTVVSATTAAVAKVTSSGGTDLTPEQVGGIVRDAIRDVLRSV